MELSYFAQIAVNSLVLASTYALIAVGLTLVFGLMNVVNFAHGEFYMMGAFVLYYLTTGLGLNYLLSSVLVIGSMGFLGMGVERFLFRRLRNDPSSMLILAIAISSIFQHSFLLIFGPDDRVLNPVLRGTIRIFGVSLSEARLVVIIVGIVLISASALFLRKSKIGMAMRAVAQDEEASSLRGVNVSHIRLMGMGIGCSLAAAASVAVVHLFTINPYIGSQYLMKAFIIVIVGGLGSFSGSILGGALLGVLDGFGLALIGYPAHIVGFVVVFLLLVFRRRGIWGHD
ncbi:MAG: branched-chain amino acid ABC transporter permease [Thermodesulfobacteriota bacterium]